jgi:ribosomal protein S18 acetylase RimI-like enzyme
MVDMETAPASSAPPVTVRLAGDSELPEVLRVQKAGFRRVAARFGFTDEDMPPLRETLTDLEALRATGVRTFLAVTGAEKGECVVGTVRATVRDDGVIEIGRLAVDDGFVRLGIASALMNALEAAYPKASRFELYTGSEATDALALYDKLGYRVFRREEFDDWTRVWLGKDAAHATVADTPPLH